MSRLRSALSTVLFLVASLALLPPAGLIARGDSTPAVLPTPPQPADLIASLRAQAGDALRIAYHAETGKVRFIGTDNDHPLRQPAALAPGATSEQAARQFLGAYGSLFGLSDQAQELKVMRAEVEKGAAFVRFQQTYQGIPVLGGELIVNLDRNQNVRSVNGELLPDLKLNVTPRLSAAAARDRALAAIAKGYGINASSLRASAPELWIFNQALLGGPGLRRNTLAWRMELRGVSAAGADIRELTLVDAQVGVVALHFNQIAEAKQRFICDGNNVPDNDNDQDNNCSTRQPPVFVRVEGQAATGNADVDLAYDYSGITYDYFFSNFGRDSLDGKGLALYSLVRYCPTPSSCPYQNANWDGKQMTYGAGFATGDDVVGHELSHGLTEFTSGLFYYYQSGAINESLSDVFGELIDLTDGRGNDAAAVRWQIGEDLSIGAIRNMQNPPAFNDPDRMGSPNYFSQPCGVLFDPSCDNGGVHINSGVNNKTLYLIADGDTFNSQTVNGLGLSKAGQLYYRVESAYLTSASDYQDLASALRAACIALIGSHGITATDCAEVNKAVLATEMDQVPSAAPATDAPVCAAGQVPRDLFIDTIENAASGFWTHSATTGTDYWFYPQSANPFGVDFIYATSGKNEIWGYADGGTPSQPVPVADYNIRMNQSIALPANAFMHFRHAYQFESDSSGTYDGGVVEYSVNNGASWTDAGSLFINNTYNGTIDNGFSNPLGGRNGFVGESHGYISSRLNLSSRAGQSIRFRFRIGTDGSFAAYGWFIDDVRIYTCVTYAERLYLPVTRR
jgi:Zn-dependent metalloprotease